MRVFLRALCGVRVLTGGGGARAYGEGVARTVAVALVDDDVWASSRS